MRVNPPFSFACEFGVSGGLCLEAWTNRALVAGSGVEVLQTQHRKDSERCNYRKADREACRVH
jgi:hypothetical protein